MTDCKSLAFKLPETIEGKQKLKLQINTLVFLQLIWIISFNGRRSARLLVMTIGALLGSAIKAEEAKYDMRELCRSEVNGVLLGAHNDVDMLNGLIEVSEKKIVASERRRKGVEQELRQSQVKSPQAVPVFELDEKIVALRFESSALKEQVLEAQMHLTKYRQDLQAKIEFRQRFEALLPPAFALVKSRQAPPGAYNLRVEYKRVCGPYELLCSLPMEHSQGLQKILPNLSNPEWCQRYAQLQPLRH